MKYTPLVSIVIPAYNASNYLSEAIDSALSQTYKNIEIIVVNDGSDDNGATERMALSYGDKVRYFCKTNGGSSSALNYGIKNMRGEWFSWLSHDDLYYPQKIEKQVELLNTEKGCTSNIEDIVLFSASDIIDANGNYIRKSDNVESERLSKFIYSLKDNKYLISEPTKYTFHGCSCLINRKVLKNVGLFDENLRIVNDVDLWFRIYTSGYIIRFIPESLVMGRIHGKQVSVSVGYSYHNTEQDMYWQRCLNWITRNCNAETDFDIFFNFFRCALSKTRYIEGYKIGIVLQKNNMIGYFKLLILGSFFMIKAYCREIFKTIYLYLKTSSKKS